MAFNDYEVLGSIGSAGQGMALAWRELPIGVRGHYALQWINDWRAGDPEYQLRLLCDATLGQQIDHPTLVKVHEVLLENDRAAVITDYVDGVALEDVLVRREAASDPVSGAIALELAARLLDAVAHLHGLQRPDGGPCFHGRITPAKVMLTIDGGVKLCGFGIAPGVPERRAAERLGPAADQYAIGVILLDLLQGRRMAVEESLQPTAGQWPRALDQALREVDVRDPVLPVLLRLLAPEPEDRYPSAAEASLQVLRVRSRLPGTQRLPAFASAEVERVRGDVTDDTDVSAADPVVPWGSQPEVEIWDEPGCEWMEAQELDEDLALTIPAGRELPGHRTVPFGEEFVPKAGQWWSFDCDEDLSSTEPLGSVDPSLLGPEPATDTSATLPFAASYSPAGVRTKTVPSWVLGAETAPIPWGSSARIPAIPPAAATRRRPARQDPWGSCVNVPVAPAVARAAAERAAAQETDPWGSCADVPASTLAAQETIPWGSCDRMAAVSRPTAEDTHPWSSNPSAPKPDLPPPAAPRNPWDSASNQPLPSMSAITTPIRARGPGVTRHPPRRRPAPGPLSLPGARVKERRRRRRKARRRGVRQPAPHRGADPGASGFVRRWSAESWMHKSTVVRSFLVIVAFTLLIAVVEGFKRQWVDPQVDEDAGEPVGEYVAPDEP